MYFYLNSYVFVLNRKKKINSCVNNQIQNIKLRLNAGRNEANCFPKQALFCFVEISATRVAVTRFQSSVFHVFRNSFDQTSSLNSH